MASLLLLCKYINVIRILFLTCASDPFVFELDWPTPSKPAASLVTVPDELKGQGPPPMPLEITATEADAPRLSLQPTEAEPTMRPRSMTMEDSPSYVSTHAYWHIRGSNT